MNLTELYREFLAGENRKEDVSMSLESARAITAHLDAEQPANVLDLGAGWTSWFLRTWHHAAHGDQPKGLRASAPPAGLVVTTDKDETWLAQTKSELEARGLPVENFYRHTDFAHNTGARLGQYEAIVLDLGKATGRHLELPLIDRCMAPSGILFVDDWQFEHHKLPCVEWFTENGWTWETLPNTRDKFGRFMAAAWRA